MEPEDDGARRRPVPVDAVAVLAVAVPLGFLEVLAASGPDGGPPLRHVLLSSSGAVIVPVVVIGLLHVTAALLTRDPGPRATPARGRSTGRWRTSH